MENAMPVWCNLTKKLIDKLEKCQLRALIIVYGLQKTTSKAFVYDISRFDKLEDRQNYLVLCTLY